MSRSVQNSLYDFPLRILFRRPKCRQSLRLAPAINHRWSLGQSLLSQNIEIWIALVPLSPYPIPILHSKGFWFQFWVLLQCSSQYPNFRPFGKPQHTLKTVPSTPAHISIRYTIMAAFHPSLEEFFTEKRDPCEYTEDIKKEWDSLGYGLSQTFYQL